MFTLSRDDRLKQEDVPNVYPWEPQHFAAFVRRSAGIDVGTVHVPTLLNNPLFVSAALLSLLPLGWQALRIYRSKWFGHPAIWVTAVLLVYGFAASGKGGGVEGSGELQVRAFAGLTLTFPMLPGGMYNVIRGIPMTNVGRDGKLQWYMQQGQLGAEGFAVGGLYLLFALSSSSLVFFPRWLGNGAATRSALYIALLVAAFAVVKIVDFFTYKTGYRLRMYVFEGLRR